MNFRVCHCNGTCIANERGDLFEDGQFRIGEARMLSVMRHHAKLLLLLLRIVGLDVEGREVHLVERGLREELSDVE